MTTVLSRGAVQLDARAAREKLRDYMLAEPALYVVELARAAAASEATAISVRNDSDDLELTFDGLPFPARTLVHVLDHVFDARSVRDRLLAIGINTALGLRPSFVDVYTSEAAGPTVTRVRWTAEALVADDGSLGKPRVDEVERPAGMPHRGTRVHVRERLGMAVLGEALSSGPPVETARLGARATARSIGVSRGSTRIAPTAPQGTLVRESARTANVGTVEMSLPGTGRLDLAEHGFLLERRTLQGAGGPMPLDVLVDAPMLPTNASRSQVAFDEAAERALSQTIAALATSVVRAAIASLSGPHADALRDALAALVLARWGARWPASTAASTGDAGHEEVDGLLFDAPIIPLAAGGHCSPRTLAATLSSQGALVWRKRAPLDATLLRWLDPVVWLPAGPSHVAALIEIVGTVDAERAVARAKRLASRWERWQAHPTRVPAVDRRSDDELVRVPFGDARAAGDGADAVVRDESGATEGIVGEVVVRAATADAGLSITAFVQGRPLDTTARVGPPLCVDVAVGSPALRPNAELDGVSSDEALRRAIGAAARALLAALELCLDAGKATPDDARLRWLAPGLARATPDAIRLLARLGVDLLAGSFGGEPGVQGSAHRRIAARPALGSAPVWPTTTGTWLSTADVARLLSERPHALCFAPAGSTGTRADGRPVLAVDERAVAVLRALQPVGWRLVDYAPYIDRTPRGELTLPSSESAPFPALSIARAGVRALVAPSVAAGALVLMHRGRVVHTAPRSGPLGNATLVIEDDALVPDAEIARETLSAAGVSLELTADFELAGALGHAARGEPQPSSELRILQRALPLHAVHFLLAAVGALGRRARDERLAESTPTTSGELLRLLERAPFLEVQHALGPTTPTTVAEIMERAAEGPLAWISGPAPDVDLGKLAPLVLRDDSLADAITEHLGVELIASHDVVERLRAAQARAGELERWARAQPRDARDPEEITGRPAARVRTGTAQAVAALAETPRGTVTIRWRDCVVGVRALELPVRVVVLLESADMLTLPEGLSRDSEPSVARLVAKAVRELVVQSRERLVAGSTSDAELGFVAQWVVGKPPKPMRADLALLEALGHAPIWRLAQGGLGSAVACVAGQRVRTSRAFFPQWRGPDDPREEDVPPAIHLVGDTELYTRCLQRLTGHETIDDSETLSRLQRMRIARATVDVAQLRFPDAPPAPALSGRIERMATGLGFGELRLVPTTGPPMLELSIVDPDAGGSRVSIPAPIGLAAIVQTLEPEARLTLEDRQRHVAEALVSCAHRLVDEALAARAELPTWADRAVRWHLLTTLLASPGGQATPAFRDSAGEPMTVRDLDAEVSLHASVAFSTWWPPEPLAPAEPLLRIVLLQEWELEWLRAHRPARDCSSELADDWTARAFHAAAPATTIGVSDAVPSEAQRFVLTPRKHGYDGELVLLPWSGEADAKVCWYHQRRPLGRSAVPSPWPSIVSVDVPGLVPNRAYTAPTHDAAYLRTVGDVADLVHSFVADRFRAPDDAVAWVHTWHPMSPARAGARTLLLGVLWLPPDAQAETHVDIYTSAPTPSRWSPVISEGGRTIPVPLAGSLYFHRDVRDTAAREELSLSLVRWAHRQMLQTMATELASREATEAELAHATRAIVDGLHAPLAKWAMNTRLPGSVTPFDALPAHTRPPRAIFEVPPGEGRARTESGVVEATDSAWLALLRARGLTRVLGQARPEPTLLTPAAQAGASGEPASGHMRVLALLRSCGIGPAWLTRVEAREGKGKRPVKLAADGPEAVLDTTHPAVAAWLVDGDPAAVARLAALVVSELNRASLEVTDDDEARALVQLLEGLAVI